MSRVYNCIQQGNEAKTKGVTMNISQHNISMKEIVLIAKATKRVKIWVDPKGTFYLTTKLIVKDTEYTFFSYEGDIKNSKNYEDTMDMLGIQYQVNDTSK